MTEPPRRRALRAARTAKTRRRRRVQAVVATALVLCTGAVSAWATMPGLRESTTGGSLAALPAAVSQLVDRGSDVSRKGRTPKPSPSTVASSVSTAEPTGSPEPPAAPEATPTPTATPAPSAAPEAPAPTAAPEAPAPAPVTTTTPPAPAAPAAPVLTKDQQFAASLVTLTNAERAKAGLPALTVSDCATGQAVGRAQILVDEDRFEHDPLDPILAECGPGSAGENLALGYATPEAMMVGWMNSEGHRANILRSYSSIGIGCVSGQRGMLCAQVFLG